MATLTLTDGTVYKGKKIEVTYDPGADIVIIGRIIKRKRFPSFNYISRAMWEKKVKVN